MAQLRAGSNDTFFGPIPADMLQLGVFTNLTIEVRYVSFDVSFSERNTYSHRTLTENIPCRYLSCAESRVHVVSLCLLCSHCPQMRVNNVLAACATPSGLCTFQYDVSVTPVVAAVSPGSLNFTGVSILDLVITGAPRLQGNIQCCVYML